MAIMYYRKSMAYKGTEEAKARKITYNFVTGKTEKN
jgi:hypothetical protein